jgi:hypothetical protein
MRKPSETAATEALRALWKYVAHQPGHVVTPEYGKAVSKAAKVLGKRYALRKQRGGVMLIKECEP